MTNGRPSPRSPGRTPPFILVGLLLLVCVLAYNYWTLSARNSDLTARAEKLEVDVRSASEGHDTAHKSLVEANEKLRVSEGNLDQVRQTLKEREAELESFRNEVSKLQGNENKCKEDLSKCDGEVETKGQNLEGVIAEKRGLEDIVAALKQKGNTCELEQCLPSVQGVVTIFTKVVDPQILRKALDGAQLDSNKIMGPPAENPPPDNDKQPAEGGANAQPNNPAEVNQQPPNDNVAEAKKAGDQVNASTVSMATNEPGTSSPASSNVTSEKLVFQPDGNDAEDVDENIKEETENVEAPTEVVHQNINKDNILEIVSNDEKEVVDKDKEGVVLSDKDQFPDERV